MPNDKKKKKKKKKKKNLENLFFWSKLTQNRGYQVKMLRFPLCKIEKGIPVCSHDSDK